MADRIEQAEKSVVRIETQTDDGKVLGSGFLVQPGIVMTNVHVLSGARTATVILSNDQMFRIEGTLFTDPARDIAIAKLSSPAAMELPSLKLSSAVPRKGDQVVALGSPLGLSFTATSGVVSAVRAASEISKEVGRDLAGTWIQIDAALSSGNSGGPIINSEGQVVAMSTLASQTAQNLNFGISAADIQQTLELADARTVTQLSDIAKVANGSGPKRGDGFGQKQVSISDSAVLAYIERGLTEASDLKQDLARELSSLRGLPRKYETARTDVVYEVLPNKKGE